MSITIDQVPCWLIVGSKSHVVMSASDPGTRTACGTIFWGVFPARSKRAKRVHNGRICVKCRAALENVEVKQPPTPPATEARRKE